MPDLDARLTRCFRAVFPAVDEGAIPSMQMGKTAAWDSMASVMLLRVIEEEFGASIDLFDLDDLRSFEDLRQYLARNGN